MKRQVDLWGYFKCILIGLSLYSGVCMSKYSLEKRIKHFKLREGVGSSPYPDAHGKSIGHGHFLSKKELATGKVYGFNFKKPGGLTKSEMESILKRDIIKHDAEADKVLKHFKINKQSLSPTQLVGVQDMVYQLGSSKAKLFKKMFGAIKNNNWEAASREAEKSNWFKQTPVRVRDFQERIKNIKETPEAN